MVAAKKNIYIKIYKKKICFVPCRSLFWKARFRRHTVRKRPNNFSKKCTPLPPSPFSECLRNQLNERNVQELNKHKSISFNLNSSVIGIAIFIYVLKWLHNDTLRPFEHKRF